MTVTLDVEVQGSYEVGLRSRPHADGVWEPGEGSSIADMRVVLVGGDAAIDITSALSADKLSALEEDVIDLCGLD